MEHEHEVQTYAQIEDTPKQQFVLFFNVVANA